MSTNGLPRILIVDDSRIVRATIIKRIRDRFEVREEVDGEAGWEALLVDATLKLVITDHTMPRLDGFGLIERIRASRVGRIRDIPVIMISGDEDEASCQRAKQAGATDFITKGTGTAELLARLETLVSLGRAQGELEQARAAAMTDSVTGLLTPAALLRQAEQMFSYARRREGQVGVLVIAVDHLHELTAGGGESARRNLLTEFGKMLGGIVRREDALSHWRDDRFAIVTPGLDVRETRRFAERLRNAVAGASIRCGVRDAAVTVTCGIAGYPIDGDMPDAVLAAAMRRQEEGGAAGGDRVASNGLDVEVRSSPGIDAAIAHLAAGREDIVAARLPELGSGLLPLLRLMDRKWELGLPIAAIERHLAADGGGQCSTT